MPAQDLWARLTARQRTFAEQALPGAVPTADHSWGELDTVVLRMTHPSGEYTVKAGGPDNHHIGREIDAHSAATTPLARLGRTPAHVASDRGSRVLVTTFLPGDLVGGTAAERSADVHRQAGELLRFLHHALPAIPDDGAWEAAENAKMLGRLDRPHAIPDSTADSARRILRSLRPRRTVLVPTHGDWQPRNWIMNAGVVSVIDYGRFAFRPALTDLTRPAEQQWRADPALGVAHADGYGRDLRDDPLWPAVLLREAVGTAVWAHQMGLSRFEAQGLRMLADAIARF